MVIRRAPVPLYDYSGPVFSPWFLEFWATAVGLPLLLTLGSSLAGLAIALAFGRPHLARWLSFGLAVLPLAFFASLPQDISFGAYAIAVAAVKAFFVAVLGSLFAWALFPVSARPYMRSAWFQLVLALCMTASICLYLLVVHEWTEPSELWWLGAGSALLSLLLWLTLRLCYPDRVDRFSSAAVLSLFVCAVLAFRLTGAYLAVAFLFSFAFGYLLSSLWRGSRAWVCAVVVLLVAFVWGAGKVWSYARAHTRSGSDRPNFVVVVPDAMRYDALEAYGGAVPTPNINELAAASAVFVYAYSSSSWTIPAVASLFTGLWSVAIGADSANHTLPQQFSTVAERLHDAGYFTAAVFDSFILLDAEGFDQGFDVVVGLREQMQFPSNMRFDVFRAPTLLAWYPSRAGLYPDHTLGSIYLAKTLLEGVKEPFMLWIHLLDPHVPYIPPRRFADHISDLDRELVWNGRRTRVYRMIKQPDSRCFWSGSCGGLVRRARDLYLGEVRLVDFAVGELVRALKRQGLWDRTVFVLTSDHGEEFGEHNGFSHGRTLYEELLRVPLIVRFPDRPPARLYTGVRTMDIAPTLLQLAGVPFDPSGMHAKSLLPVVEGKERESRMVLLETDLSGGLKHGLIHSGYKIVCYRKNDRCELFDLTRDPAEREPITSGSRFDRMHGMLLSAIDSCERLYERTFGRKRTYERKPTAEALERLKAMGYVQ